MVMNGAGYQPRYVAYLRAGGHETDPNYAYMAWVRRKAAEFKRLNGIGGLYTEEAHEQLEELSDIGRRKTNVGCIV